MRRTKGVYASKVKRATHILFYRRHQKPGVKGWELHKALGSDYSKVLEILDDQLKALDMQVKTVFEDENVPAQEPSIEELDKARFFITLRGDLTPKEAKMIGWRIDDLAGLAVSISYIISRKGKAPRKDVETLLREKLPGWKVGLNIDRYIRYGYLLQDENDQLYLDWRSRTELDQKELINLLLHSDNTASAKLDTLEDEEERNIEID